MLDVLIILAKSVFMWSNSDRQTVPLVLEQFGHWGQQAEKYLHQLSLRSTDECGNNNSSQFKTYWRERLSVQLQRCNSRVIYRKVGLLDRGDE